MLQETSHAQTFVAVKCLCKIVLTEQVPMLIHAH